MALGSAPGRLDVLGGVADYSEAWVLQKPIRARTTVIIGDLDGDRWTVESPGHDPVAVPVATLTRALDGSRTSGVLDAAPADHHVAQSVAAALADLPAWSRYVLGSLALGMAETGWRPGGRTIQVHSDVPEAMSVSSSAALEVATLRAVAATSGVPIDQVRLAHLGQLAENVIVGAPCGLMDQLASSCGQPGALLPILCRPDQVGEPILLPDDLVIVGWPSGQRHAVSGSPYRTARTAAFIAKAILDRAAMNPPLTDRHPDELASLPDTITGSELGDLTLDDSLSFIDPFETYPVAAAARFAVGEHARVQRAVDVLRRGSPDAGPVLGRLMRASHDGYGEIGLGAPVTDAMVAALDRLGPASGVHGGRVSGGGCGGTVVVCADRRALPVLEKLADDHGVALIH